MHYSYLVNNIMAVKPRTMLARFDMLIQWNSDRLVGITKEVYLKDIISHC